MLAFHHLGLACEKPARGAAFLQSLGYTIGETQFDPLQDVHLIMCTSPSMPAVEIISPAGPGGPLEAILADGDARLYHMCYETTNRDDELKQLKQAGHRILTVLPAKPAVLFGGLTVSFHMVSGFGLIEILERPATP